jgi:hypothetical protein
MERDSIFLTIDEVHKLYVETDCKMLEDYVTELGENGHEFQQAFMDVMGKGGRTKARDILLTIRELWLECNVLHKAGVFMR